MKNKDTFNFVNINSLPDNFMPGRFCNGTMHRTNQHTEGEIVSSGNTSGAGCDPTAEKVSLGNTSGAECAPTAEKVTLGNAGGAGCVLVAESKLSGRGAMPQVMGILNINNESFYQGSRHTSLEEVDAAFGKMVAEGADIIDIGACSTRPGSTPVTLEQEWAYLQEPLKMIKEEWLSGRAEVQVSLDTFRSEIVRRAYDVMGDFIVNDISAGDDDPQMLSTVGELGLPYIAMHKRGTPDIMQQLTDYPQGVVNAVVEYFKEFEQRAANAGIKEYVMDPGFGFAKNLEQNYELFKGIPKMLAEVAEYAGVRRKLLVGISRKGMIWKPLGITPDEALCGTVALNLQALLLGADILRVHDVAQARQCVKLWEMLR